MNVENAACSNSKYAYVTKTCSMSERQGHPQKIYDYDDTYAYTYNRLGCPNPGISSYEKRDTPFVLSILPECLKYDFSLMEWLKGIEVNVSCPNMSAQIPAFSRLHMKQICICLADIKRQWPKLSTALKLPYYGCASMIKYVADLCNTYNISYVVCCNSFPGLYKEKGEKGEKHHPPEIVGISSPHFRPLVLGNCFLFVQHGVSVVGCCGISCAKDVAEFVAVGCCGVQVGSAFYRNPSIVEKLRACL